MHQIHCNVAPEIPAPVSALFDLSVSGVFLIGIVPCRDLTESCTDFPKSRHGTRSDKMDNASE
jgi:hypothetical protein